jgi:hypothetical protein
MWEREVLQAVGLTAAGPVDPSMPHALEIALSPVSGGVGPLVASLSAHCVPVYSYEVLPPPTRLGLVVSHDNNTTQPLEDMTKCRKL